MNKKSFKEAESPKDRVPNSGRGSSLVLLNRVARDLGPCKGIRNFLGMRTFHTLSKSL